MLSWCRERSLLPEAMSSQLFLIVYLSILLDFHHIFVQSAHIHPPFKVIPESVMEEGKLEATTKTWKLDRLGKALIALSTQMCSPRHQTHCRCMNLPSAPLLTVPASRICTCTNWPQLWTHITSLVGRDSCTGLRSGTLFSIFLRASPQLSVYSTVSFWLWLLYSCLRTLGRGSQAAIC